MTAAVAKKLMQDTIDEEVAKSLASVYARISDAARKMQAAIVVSCPRAIEASIVAAKLKEDGFEVEAHQENNCQFTVCWA